MCTPKKARSQHGCLRAFPCQNPPCLPFAPLHPPHPLSRPHTTSHPPPRTRAGFVLAASNIAAGRLSDMTSQAGLGNVGCFGGGAVACAAALLLLGVFAKFGALGSDDEVVTRRKK